MTIIEKLESDLAKVGATLDTNSQWHIYADAPSGYVWRASGTRCLTATIENQFGQRFHRDGINDIRERVVMGLDKITDQEEIDEHRYDTGEDDWGAPEDAPEFIAWISK
jgi:hypothetical protein